MAGVLLFGDFGGTSSDFLPQLMDCRGFNNCFKIFTYGSGSQIHLGNVEIEEFSFIIYQEEC